MEKLALCLVPLVVAVIACKPDSRSEVTPAAAVQAAERPAYALAIHGGAGVIPKSMAEEQKQQYFAELERALTLGRDLLAQGTASLDVVEQVVRTLEDSPLFNAGKGAVFTRDGHHELDAAIMDGRDLACGAVAGVRRVKNPITLARRVMEGSPHVFLVGAGAEQFAAEQGLEVMEASYFHTERRWQQLQDALAKEAAAASSPGDAKSDDKHGTVGAVALDQAGNLAAATSTGGLTAKRWGRVGDVPVVGAGTYANNRTAAISCTGFGEEFIRYTVAHDVSALVEYAGLSLQEAAEKVIHEKLRPGDGGLVAVGRDGAIALVFNSGGMFRGAADANGRFDIAIWE